MRRVRTRRNEAGGVVATPSVEYWWIARERLPKIIAKFANVLESPPASTPYLTQVHVRLGCGLRYFLTFCVPGTNDRTVTYKALFLRRPGSLPDEFVSLEKVQGSEVPSSDTSPPPDTFESIARGLNVSNIRFRAYCLFVKQKKDANPDVKYSKKLLGAEWRRLSEYKQVKLMTEVALKIKAEEAAELKRVQEDRADDDDAVNRHEEIMQAEAAMAWDEAARRAWDKAARRAGDKADSSEST